MTTKKPKGPLRVVRPEDDPAEPPGDEPPRRPRKIKGFAPVTGWRAAVRDWYEEGSEDVAWFPIVGFATIGGDPDDIVVPMVGQMREGFHLEDPRMLLGFLHISPPTETPDASEVIF